MARPPGRRDRSNNHRIISKPDHIGIRCVQWLDSSNSYCSGAPIESEPRGRVGLAHWPCGSCRNDHGLRAIACSIEFVDPTAADLLQPVPEWPAGAACTEERVLVVPRTLLVCSQHNLRRRSLICFRWGVAGAAFQIEGAAKDEGRGPSVWDALSRVTNHIVDNSTADVADNVSFC